MVKTLLFIVFTLLIVKALCQDIILKRDGSDIVAKVKEIDNFKVKYKKYSNPDGPLYTISIDEIFMIKYENGQKDIFKISEQEEAISSDDTKPRVNGFYICEVSEFEGSFGANKMGYMVLKFQGEKVYRLGFAKKENQVEKGRERDYLKKIFENPNAMTARLFENLMWEGTYQIFGNNLEVVFSDITNNTTIYSVQFHSIPEGENPKIKGYFNSSATELIIRLKHWPKEFQYLNEGLNYTLNFRAF